MEYLDCNLENLIKRLNMIQSKSDDSFFDYDIENKVSRIAAHGVKKYGMPRTVEGMPESFAEQFIIEEDRADFISMYSEMLETNKAVSRTYRLKDGNGFVHWDECNMIPVSDKLAIGYVRDITDEKQLEYQLAMMEELTVVESLLISTHRDENCLGKALEKVSEFLECQGSLVFMLESDTHLEQKSSCIKDDYLRQAAEIVASRSFPRLQNLVRALSKGTLHISADDIEQYAIMMPNVYKLFLGGKLKNLYLVPIQRNGQEVTGFIAFASKGQMNVNGYFMKLIGLSFSRAFDNIEEQKKIESLNSYDLSTHLLNRNKYIEFLRDFSAKGVARLTCVLFDVNGLHEYNNSNGHALGDSLLLSVADSLRLAFGPHMLFRTGGDEFVAVCYDEEKEKIEQRVASMKQDLAAKNIFVSSGVCCRESDIEPEAMLKEADKAMYADKDAFYQSRRNIQKR